MRATILAPATLATSIVGTENSFVTVSVTVSAPAVTVETEVVVVVDVTVAVVVDTKGGGCCNSWFHSRRLYSHEYEEEDRPPIEGNNIHIFL